MNDEVLTWKSKPKTLRNTPKAHLVRPDGTTVCAPQLGTSMIGLAFSWEPLRTTDHLCLVCQRFDPDATCDCEVCVSKRNMKRAHETRVPPFFFSHFGRPVERCS